MQVNFTCRPLYPDESGNQLSGRWVRTKAVADICRPLFLPAI